MFKFFKTIKQKIIFTLLTFFILGLSALFFYISHNFKAISDQSARDQLQTLSAAVFQGINTGMKLGNPEEELEKLRAIEGIEDLKVYRSQDVIDIFGKPEKAIKDGSIKQVYESKQDMLEDVYHDAKHLFVLKKPLVANAECVACHANAKEGDVLGVMELEISFEKIDASLSAFETNLTIGMLVAALFAITVFSIFFKQVVLKPISYLTERAKDLSAGEGDLTQRLHILANDEVGEASTYINYFIEKIEYTVNDAKNSSEKNIDLSSTLSQTTNMIQERTKEGQVIVEDTTRMGEELRQVLTTSVNVAEKTKVDIAHANELLQGSRQKISDMAEGIQQSADMEAELSRSLQQLSGDAEQVKGVLTMISDIADQTNLLALNAAIEAARAGEHGRGFAVVADEVRKLAERTQKSLSEINAIINTIVQSITDASDHMSENARKINEINETSMEVENRIAETSDLMDNAYHVSEQSLKESIHMSGEVSNIISKISQINEISKQNELSVDDIQHISNDINEIAQELNKQLMQFKS